MRHTENTIKILMYDKYPNLKQYGRVNIKIEVITTRIKNLYNEVMALIDRYSDDLPEPDVICLKCINQNKELVFCRGGINQFSNKKKCSIKKYKNPTP